MTLDPRATTTLVPPGRAPFTRSQRLTLLAMCVGTMVTFLQITASVSSLSAVQASLQVSPGTLVWIPSAYTLAVAALVLSSGTLGNVYGRRRMFRLGTVVLALGAVVVVLAGSVPVVIAGQVVAGVGGALVLPNSLAVLASSFPDPHRRTEVITLWAASSGVGLAVGPLVAGVLLDHVSWNAAFVPAVVLSLAALLLSLGPVPETRQPGSRLDPAGLGLGTTAIGALVVALIEGGRLGYGSGEVVAALAVATVALVALVLVELRVAQPMLDVRLFSNRSFAAVTVVAAVSLFGFTGMALTQVLFLQRAQSVDALGTGWRLLAMFGTYVVVASIAGRVVRRTGFVAPLAGGLLLGALGALGLLGQDAGSSYAGAWVWLAVFGAGVGLVAAPSTAAAMVSVHHEQSGMASASVNAARQLGSVMGSSILGALVTSTLVRDLPDELAAHGVPPGLRAGAVDAVATGHAPALAPPPSVHDAVAAALTGGVHHALLVIACVFAASAVLTVACIRNRP